MTKKAKIWDFFAALPIVIWFSVVAFTCLKDLTDVTRAASLKGFIQIANGAFALILIVLIILRPPPIARMPGWKPIAAGFGGGIAPMGILLLPPAKASLIAGLASEFLILIGTLGSVWAAFSLGRSFSILPQARKLITAGPYRLIRHPLYLFEFIILLGVSLQFKFPLSILFWIIAVIAQFPRINYEEEILRRTFPEYISYAARTKRIIPGFL